MIYTFDPPDDTLWTLGGSAAFVTPAAGVPISEPQVLSLFARRSNSFGNLSSTATRTFTVTPGATYPIRMWTYGDEAGSVTLELRVTDSAGVNTYTLSAPLGSGMQPWEPLIYTAADTTVEFRLRTPVPSGSGVGLGTGGRWYLDDFEIDSEASMSLSKWGAIQGAVTVLKGITGSDDGYNANLGERVYTRLFTPAEQPDIEKPYCCLPLDAEAERVTYEGYEFNSTWRMVGHAFFGDNQESDPLNCQGSMDAAGFRDDLIRSFMADQSLGGRTLNCEVVSIDTASGVIDDGIAEVMFTIEFTQEGGASDLEAA